MRPAVAHLVPIASVIYFLWAGVSIDCTVQAVMWLLVFFCSLPMLAYLETMRAGMARYKSELVELLQPRSLKIGREYLTRLLQLLPHGRLFAAFVIGHAFLYLVVIDVAWTAGLYLVLAVQIAYPVYLGWVLVFLPMHIGQTKLPPR